MPIYNLFLSTSRPTTANGYKDDSMIIAGYRHGAKTTDNGQEVYYNIDWDKLFKGDNYNPQYTKCRVYSKFLNHRGNTNDVYGYHTGRLSTNLASNNYLSGTSVGNPLCAYYYQELPTQNREYYSNFNTENITGMEIEIPRGKNELALWYGYITRTVPNNVASLNQRDVFGILYFELF
jgi:hypothetical protein